MFTTKDLMLCYGQAQTVLLPFDFLLLWFFGSNSRGHHNDLGILLLDFRPEAQQQLWRETLSLLCSKVCRSCNQKSLPIKDGTQIRVVREQPAPKHLIDLHKTATAQVLLFDHASPEVLPNPLSNGLLSFLTFA